MTNWSGVRERYLERKNESLAEKRARWKARLDKTTYDRDRCYRGMQWSPYDQEIARLEKMVENVDLDQIEEL